MQSNQEYSYCLTPELQEVSEKMLTEISSWQAPHNRLMRGDCDKYLYDMYFKHIVARSEEPILEKFSYTSTDKLERSFHLLAYEIAITLPKNLKRTNVLEMLLAAKLATHNN